MKWKIIAAMLFFTFLFSSSTIHAACTWMTPSYGGVVMQAADQVWGTSFDGFNIASAFGGQPQWVVHQNHSIGTRYITFQKRIVEQVAIWDNECNDSVTTGCQVWGTAQLWAGTIPTNTYNFNLPTMTNGQGRIVTMPANTFADKFVYTPNTRQSGTIDSGGYNLCVRDIPTLACPSSQTATCSADGTSAYLWWAAVPGASNYTLRIDRAASSWYVAGQDTGADYVWPGNYAVTPGVYNTFSAQGLIQNEPYPRNGSICWTGFTCYAPTPTPTPAFVLPTCNNLRITSGLVPGYSNRLYVNEPSSWASEVTSIYSQTTAELYFYLGNTKLVFSPGSQTWANPPNNAILSRNWTPTSTGTYQIGCHVINSQTGTYWGYGCMSYSPVTQTNKRIPCLGSPTSITVNVVTRPTNTPTRTPTRTPTPTRAPTITPTKTITPTRASILTPTPTPTFVGPYNLTATCNTSGTSAVVNWSASPLPNPNVYDIWTGQGFSVLNTAIKPYTIPVTPGVTFNWGVGADYQNMTWDKFTKSVTSSLRCNLPTNTPTRTPTIVPPTNTPTRTPTKTPTPTRTNTPTSTKTPTPPPEINITGNFRQKQKEGSAEPIPASFLQPIPVESINVPNLLTNPNTCYTQTCTESPENVGYSCTLEFNVVCSVYVPQNFNVSGTLPATLLPYYENAESNVHMTGPNVEFTVPLDFVYLGGPWIKLKDTSFTRYPGATAKLTNNIPYILDVFDSDDEGKKGMIDESFGGGGGYVAGDNNLVDILPLNYTSPVNNYRINSGYTLGTNYADIISGLNIHIGKLLNYKAITTTVLVSSDLNLTRGQIYVVEGANIDADEIVFTGVSSDPTLLIVKNGADYGTLRVNTNINTNPTSGAFTIIAGDIQLGAGVTEVRAIIVSAGTFDTSNSNSTLKVYGNLLALRGINQQRKRADLNNAKPTVFVVHDPQMYLDMLPLLSINEVLW